MTLHRFGLVLSVMLAIAASVSTELAAHEGPPLRGRLVFADHEKPVVRVLDLDTGEVTHSFDLPKANPTLAALDGGRFVAIKTGDEKGTVRFLDTGLIRESHGDHDDIDKAPVGLLELTLTGERPSHVVSGHGKAALFFDGIRPWEGKPASKFVLIGLADLGKPNPRLAEWPSPGPQHGIVVPLGKREWLVSMPNPAYVKGDDRAASSRPNGFEIRRETKDGWKPVASFNDPAKTDASCALYHGYAARRGRHVFGCAEGESGGMLVLRRIDARWSAHKLAYPDDRRISTIKARDRGAFMVANYGRTTPYTALLRVDPSAKGLTPSDVLAIPGNQPACHFELSQDGERLANLTPDGQLRIYELAPAWKEIAAFDAVAAFDCAYGAKTPTPSLAVRGASAFVSDPVNGRIREYHLDTLKQGLDMTVGGNPANIAGSDGG